MLRYFLISLIAASTLTLCACGFPDDGGDSPDLDVSSLVTDGDWDENTDNDFLDIIFPPGGHNQEEPDMLERGEDGILIGSMVFMQPRMLVGDFKDGETEENVINVRAEPTIESDVMGQINYRKVVEATEVVEGWYRVTVLSNKQEGMLSGFIRSDLLKDYSEEGTHNRTQIGSQVFDEPVLLVGAVTLVNVREGPGIQYPVVAALGFGQVAEATEVVDGWYRVTVFPGMFEGYADSEILVEYVENRQFFANTREDSVRVAVAGLLESRVVDVRAYIPDIECYMIFATPDNFTGRTLYDRDVPILQYGTVQKLIRAQQLFAQDGYRIKIYDAYRPSSVSGVLSEIITDPQYVAPAGRSTHNRAAAIDMTLIDANGNELEMPSPMHTFNSTSNRNSGVMSEEAKKNMNYMTSIMQRCGFTTVQSEWWHFNDSDRSKYPPLDIPFRDFTFYFVDN